MARYVMAIDQGTTGSTVSLVDRQAKIVASYDLEHNQIYPKPGWVEHNPEEIWSKVTEAIGKVLLQANIQGSEVAAIGITNQRETVVAWNAQTQKPLSNAIVWQCRRTSQDCDKIKKNKALAKQIQNKTGLVVDAYFSATKMRWLIQNSADVKECHQKGHLRFGTMDTFLIWQLTRGRAFKTDVSNASRTQLMNLKNVDWDSALLDFFKIKRESLAEICSSNEVMGYTLDVPGLPDGIPISGVAGDQQAALFGQACFEVGLSKCTFGTGSFLLLNTGTSIVRSKAGLLTTVAWQLKGKDVIYALEGGAFICGAAVQWLRDEMQMIQKSSDIEPLAKQVSSTEGVYFVPAFVGLGAPHWKSEARGALVGMTRGTNRAHVARAILESMALQNVDILKAMEKDLGRKLKALRVDGGAVANDTLMQMQADFLGLPVERPTQTESTTLGAALLAGLGSGFWSSLDEIKKIRKVDQVFKPILSAKLRQQKLDSWAEALAKV